MSPFAMASWGPCPLGGDGHLGCGRGDSGRAPGRPGGGTHRPVRLQVGTPVCMGKVLAPRNL